MREHGLGKSWSADRYPLTSIQALDTTMTQPSDPRDLE